VLARKALGCLVVLMACGFPVPAWAAEWFVAAGASGTGTAAAPFGLIQKAIDLAQPGDTVTVAPGTYAEGLHTVRDGASGRPIRLRSSGARGPVVVSTPGRVLRVMHADFVVEGLVLDGQYASADTVTVTSAAHRFVLRNSEVRRSSRDLVDLAAPAGVVIEGCSIHHALDPTDGRSDAHGIVAGAVTDLTIRDTEIHTFSGDGIQLDPGRTAPGWNRVTVERSRIWLVPLPADENGFRAGTIPGENAIDTKANPALPRSSLVLRDVVAYGFRKGLISNMAAFNLKENVQVEVDGVTVFDSEIAFRVRGPAGGERGGARVTVANAVVYNVGNRVPLRGPGRGAAGVERHDWHRREHGLPRRSGLDRRCRGAQHAHRRHAAGRSRSPVEPGGRRRCVRERGHPRLPARGALPGGRCRRDHRCSPPRSRRHGPSAGHGGGRGRLRARDRKPRALNS
jgi:hypothetical protein